MKDYDWKYTEYAGRYLGWRMPETTYLWYSELSDCGLSFTTGTLAIL